MEKNRCINFFKGIACLGVILLHCNCVNDQTMNFLKSIARFAVLFFLMVSGYFLYSDDRKTRIKRLKKQFLKILKLTFIICTIYFLWNFKKLDFNLFGIVNWFKEFLLNPALTKQILLFNRWFFLASTVYYLFMLIYVYIIDYVATKLHLDKVLYIGSIALITLGLYTQYTNVNNLEWYYWGNWLFAGLAFFEFGSFLAWMKSKDELKCNVIFNIFLFILGFVGCAVTVIIKRTFFYYDIGAVLIATSALVFSINHPKWYILKPIEILGEKYSLDIFMLHIIIRDIVEQYRFETEIVYSYKWILLIILGSVLFGILVRTAIDLMKKLINFIETKFEKKKSHT